MPANTVLRKPSWLRVKIPAGDNFKRLQDHRIQAHLTTVCEEANCPNVGDCWGSGTATFMLMGDICTRSCRFCSVETAKYPPPLDKEEPVKLAETLNSLNLKYVVLTTVDRDDLSDQGASHIGACIAEIKKRIPGIIVELLMPDFRGETVLIKEVMHAGAHVMGHNLECTRSLTRKVRDHRAGYEQSLAVLRCMKETRPEIYTKSSLMLGFGESDKEVLEAMNDIRSVGTNFLTLGQYLQPHSKKLPVAAYIHPDKFDWFKQQGLKMGFAYVASGPLVRSSYRASENFLLRKLEK